MTPNHILSEIALRLSEASHVQINEVAQAVGINLSAASEPLPSVEDAAPALRPLMPWEGDVVHGAVPFQMRLTILGQEVTHTGRAVFSAYLVDDMTRQPSETLRILGQVEIIWQVLDWRDLDHFDEKTGENIRAPAPSWTEDFGGALPFKVSELILDQIEEQARALEAARGSNS